MWFRKASARRQAIREDVAEAESLGSPQKRNESAPMLLIAAVFFAVAVLLQFWPGEVVPYQVGETPGMDVATPVRFTVEDETRTEEARKNAREYSPPVVEIDVGAFHHLYDQLLALKQDVQDSPHLADVPAEVRARFPGLTEASLRQLKERDQVSYGHTIQNLVYEVLTKMPFVTAGDYNGMWRQRSSRVALADQKGDVQLEVDSRKVMVVGQVDEGQRKALREVVAGELPQALAEVVTGYLAGGTEPTYHFSAALTAKRADEEASRRAVGARTFEAGEVLAPAGRPITADQLQLLAHAQAEARRVEAAKNPLVYWLGKLGLLGTVLILTAAGALYVTRMNAAARTVRRGWAVCGLLLFTLIVARAGVGYFPQSLYALGVAPTLLTAIILVIAYNQRFALGMGALHGLLVTLTLHEGIDFYLAILTGVAVFSFGLTEIRTRGKLIEMGALSAAALFVAVLAVGLSRWMATPWAGHPDVKILLQQSLWAAAGGLGVAIVALAALPPVERLFRITTAMTLLELCDANKPLLRRLSQEGPGTFNHSLTVGIMAEAAGNAIGANGLLCRVGAYYHDVGKLSKPLYFIENQRSGGPNRHDKLSPAMSLLIIVGHVKDGVELAREYALPWVVHQFIEQHHGTTLVEYFFHAARKKAEAGEEGVVVSDTEFRYPGPKPQTREAAIVMICDGCESAVRAIDEPTAGRIESTVHAMIMKRLMDGQFSECDLTLRDLSIIEETLTRTLAAVHHGRVAYPVGQPAIGAARPA